MSRRGQNNPMRATIYKQLYACVNCHMSRHNEGWKQNIHRSCTECGVRIVHDVSPTTNHIHYNPGRKIVLTGLKSAPIVANRKAYWSSFPVGVFDKIDAGTELKTTHRGGPGFTQRRRVLATFGSARAFFSLGRVATRQSTGRTGEMAYVNKFGDIMVVVPPILLTNKTSNQDTASVTETLVVQYNIAMVSPRNGNVLYAIDHPMTAVKWASVSPSFDGDHDVRWHAIQAAMQLVTARVHPLSLV